MIDKGEPIMNKINLLLIAATIMSVAGCSEPRPEPKNEFERVVYSEQRLSDDLSQDKNRNPASVLAFANIRSGMQIVDLLAGSGYYTELFSPLVGANGKVILHNKPKSAEKLADKIKQRLANNRLPNVSTLASELTDMQLPENLDMIMMSKIFHDLYLVPESEERTAKVANFFEQVKQSLKDEGQVLLIDHSAIVGSKTEVTKETHRIDETFVIAEFEKHGFKLIGSSDVLRNSDDERTLNIWEGKVHKKTDRFVQLFQKL
jgi:predicted methyltransferase